MDLISLLISGVGSGVAKAVLNKWLHDEPISKEIAKNITSMISSKITDVLKRKKLERQFDELTDIVANNMLNLFQAVDYELNEKEKAEVAELAGIAVNNLNIDSDLLIKSNLNPKVIEKKLLEHSYVPNDDIQRYEFNNSQKKMYNLIISESSQLIVDISSKLPKFSEKAIGLILERQSSIIDLVNEVLEEIKIIRNSVGIENVDSKKFESDYRRQIIRKYDNLQLFGVDLSSSSKRYKLSVAYISLSVETKDKDEVINIEECLTNNNKIIVKGLAGSGKTTLLQWIAIKSAGQQMSKGLSEWNECVPFFIKLREYSNENLPSLEGFMSNFSNIYADAMPEGWVNEKLLKGKVIILLDGVDEIESSRRNIIEDWVRDFESLYPKAKIIITTRPYAVEEEWLNDIGFIEAKLQDMNLYDINHFIDHWHDASIDIEVDADEKEKIKELQIEIKRGIKNNKNLLRLANNPLLCALICSLNRERVSKLPNSRIELYSACISMFFRRDTERKVALNDYIEIGSEEKIIILSDIAYWLIRNGWSEADCEEVVKRVDKKVKNFQGVNSDITGKKIVKYFVERSGVLRTPIESKIDFPHRTFEEFFAAKAIVEEGDYGLLLSNINDDQWREVIVLTCGIARGKESIEIVNSIIEKGDSSNDMKEYYYLLSTICSEMIIELPIIVKEKINKRFKTLLPPSSMEMAKEISKFADLSLPFLTYKKNKKLGVTNIKRVMRILSYIGSEEALGMLKEYSKDIRQGVNEELLQGGKHTVNPALYGEKILGERNRIHLGGNFSLELFYHLSKIKELYLDLESTKSKNIEVLRRLEKLESLDLAYWKKGFLDITPLKELHNLKFLNINRSIVSDISPLKFLYKLENLSIAGSHIEEIDAIKDLSKLKVLNLDNRQIVSFDFKLLNNFNNLKIEIVPSFNRNLVGEKLENFIENKRLQFPNINFKLL